MLSASIAENEEIADAGPGTYEVPRATTNSKEEQRLCCPKVEKLSHMKERKEIAFS